MLFQLSYGDMKHLLTLAAVATMGACPMTIPLGRDCVEHMHFYREPQTELCFGTCGMNDEFSVVNVPCTEAVMKAIIKTKLEDQ